MKIAERIIDGSRVTLRPFRGKRLP
jgi:hypothetical protein